MSVTSNILQRTFLIRYEEDYGTCFTIDVDGKRYLITAKHIVGSIQGDTDVHIFHERGWLQSSVRLVGHCTENIDVTVLAPQELFGAPHPLRLTIGGVILAEDVHFLGFAYGLPPEVRTELNAGFPLPLVKKASVLALGVSEGAPMLLDGHNNRGFSGGPVVRRWDGKEQTVIGVVSGYKGYKESVRDKEDNKGPYTYDVNAGIVIIHNIEHALEIIKANPIGVPVI